MRDVPVLHPALSATVVYPTFLVELDWPAGFVRVWNGYHELNWNGFAWLGTGQLGSINGLRESADNAANGAQVSLSGIPSAMLSHALANNSQGRRARIYFGVINATGFTIDPYCVFDGLIDITNIVRGAETSTITVNLEKELYDDRSNARRWTHEDQQIDYPGDNFFKFVTAIANRTFTWGKATVYGTGGNGGAGDSTELTDPLT